MIHEGTPGSRSIPASGEENWIPVTASNPCDKDVAKVVEGAICVEGSVHDGVAGLFVRHV